MWMPSHGSPNLHSPFKHLKRHPPQQMPFRKQFYKCHSLRFKSGSSFDHLLRTDFGAPSAVQAAVLIDHYRLRTDVDAFLRADRVAQLTSDTALPNIITTSVHLRIPDQEPVPDYMRRLADVKIFALRLIDAEHLQFRPGIAGIDALHVRVLFEDFIQFTRADISDLSS